MDKIDDINDATELPLLVQLWTLPLDAKDMLSITHLMLQRKAPLQWRKLDCLSILLKYQGRRDNDGNFSGLFEMLIAHGAKITPDLLRQAFDCPSSIFHSVMKRIVSASNASEFFMQSIRPPHTKETRDNLREFIRYARQDLGVKDLVRVDPSTGFTPFHFVTQPEELHLLLHEAGGDINLRSRSGMHPLCYQIMHSDMALFCPFFISEWKDFGAVLTRTDFFALVDELVHFNSPKWQLVDMGRKNAILERAMRLVEEPFSW